ncbi:MAG: hypothetical protein M1493_06195 [Firmicutes bacterium]|nr:hypothetical protein [Bacillota bacterium]
MPNSNGQAETARGPYDRYRNVPLIVLAGILYSLYRIKGTPSSVLNHAGQFDAHEHDDELLDPQSPKPI